jgi:HSP20 family protein
MQLKSLIPSKQRSDVASPETALFGPLHRQLDRLFDDFARGLGPLAAGPGGNLIPRIDVAETDKAIEIAVELPGLQRGDVEIALDDNVLNLRGERQVEEDRDEKNVHVSERAYGAFYRAIELPPGVDPSSIDATMSNGVLKITVPKPANAAPKKIEVKDGHNGKDSSSSSRSARSQQ